jgi:hypothetical protein
VSIAETNRRKSGADIFSVAAKTFDDAQLLTRSSVFWVLLNNAGSGQSGNK